MLAIVENYLQALGAARSDADVTRVLAEAAKSFGFRSAYMIEYAGKLSSAQHVIDTDAGRRGWWNDYLSSDLRPTPRDVAAALAGGPLLHLDASRFGAGAEKLKAVLAEHDVIDVTAAPISHEGELVGVAGFCGTPKLDRQQETALTLIAYSAFAHRRAARGGRDELSSVILTPREREVVRLSADGLTSTEIAEKLGMSPRTANQHVDNVADKLGTRNRAHTVAEAVRRGLL
jgi:DNA-binding CsgD family transcriptional regulator